MPSAFKTSHSLIPPPSFSLSGNRKPPRPISLRPSIRSANASATTHYSANTTNASSLYQLLGIPIGATGLEIKSAYRQLARTCHPDVARKNTSPDEFVKIHAAYSTLSDPEKRADYDRNTFRIHRDFREPVFGRFGSGYTGRNWESDQCW